MAVRAALPKAPDLIEHDELYVPPGGPKMRQVPALTAQDDLPAGPFRVSMLWDFGLDGYVVPYSIVDSQGRPVAGHIPSLAIARAIRDALSGGGAS